MGLIFEGDLPHQVHSALASGNAVEGMQWKTWPSVGIEWECVPTDGRFWHKKARLVRSGFLYKLLI
ncbi:hypothetical protein THICB1_30434 [Thiomonas arsenitoxydans]|uniref:Uncharacterized protein n=1 Tax=Thiomonas arsenitoxydans (strain DSM 22701 / CIP 110005 / 3As) TaxID=426114 RepID=A0ABP1Z4E5_THIA3|nr:hypothetical protein THICB1_30434 [Thiomonas arsenitoxydans]CQR40797.1 hypothetical protein THICB6_90007 [Thiomonas arsenitoxydans]